MCGIFSAFDRDEFIALAEANAYRGQHSYSIVTFEHTSLMEIKSIHRSLGQFDKDKVPKNGYKIGHIQAPTGNHGEDCIHPAQLGENILLWHNGLIKDFDCERLRLKQNNQETWDTKLLLKEVSDEYDYLSNLSEINGSFACIYYQKPFFFVFRNVLAPLFYDGASFSSVKTELTSKTLSAETFFLIKSFKSHFENKIKLFTLGHFETKENPYFGL